MTVQVKSLEDKISEINILKLAMKQIEMSGVAGNIKSEPLSYDLIRDIIDQLDNCKEMLKYIDDTQQPKNSTDRLQLCPLCKSAKLKDEDIEEWSDAYPAGGKMFNHVMHKVFGKKQ